MTTMNIISLILQILTAGAAFAGLYVFIRVHLERLNGKIDALTQVSEVKFQALEESLTKVENRLDGMKK